MRLPVLVLVVLAVAGCATPRTEPGSGIQGTAWLGPTCPVQRDPPDPACADRPTQTALVARDGDGRVVAAFASNATGQFRVALGPGTYTLGSPDGQSLPRCSSAAITVVAGRYADADVSCDSGIR
jgi:hypothetical protein